MTKDSPELVRFMNTFQKLRDLIDDDPKGLGELVGNDPGLARFCEELVEAASVIAGGERKRRQLFTNVDPKFIAAWREYEERYSNPLFQIWLAMLFGKDPSKPIEVKSQFESRWKAIDAGADEDADAAYGAIDWSEQIVAQVDYDD